MEIGIKDGPTNTQSQNWQYRKANFPTLTRLGIEPEALEMAALHM